MNKAEDLATGLFPLLETDKIGNNPYITYNIKQLAKQEGFIRGYYQAEKDLLATKHERSWRLDGKLWKRIKGIEEASYQYTYDASNDWAYDIPTWDDVQDAFKAGSEWKEGLELTWENIEKLVDLYDDVYCDFSNDGNGGKINAEEHYQEVLKRFKDLKK